MPCLPGHGSEEKKSAVRIAVVSQPEYFRAHYEGELAPLGEFFEFPFDFSMPAEGYAPLIEFSPDLTFCFRGEFVPDSVLRALPGLKIAVSSEPFPRLNKGKIEFTFDSVMRYVFFRGIRHKPFDYLLHYDPSSLPIMRRDGLGVSGAFPLPVATSVYKPLPVPKRWDLFFIGRSTAHRERFFGPLKHHHEFLHIAHGIYGPDLVQYLSAAQICLNVHAEDEISWEPRMQLMLAAGAFVISEPITDNEWLRPGEHFVEVRTPAEMGAAVAHYLNEAGERMAIAERGRARVLDTLSSEKNFAALIDDLERQQLPRFAPGPGLFLFDAIERVVKLRLALKRR